MIPHPSRFSLFAALAATLILPGWAASAQPALPPKHDWTVSSGDLIGIVLTNNLDVLISQIQVNMDEYSLKGAYGAYEPSLTSTVVHNYDSFPSGVFTQAGIAILPTTEQINSYTPGLTGVTPWGLNYNFTGPLNEQNVQGDPDYYNSSPGVTLTQPLLKNFWINNNRFTVISRRTTLKTDQLALRNQFMTVINTLMAAYYNLIADRESVKVQEVAVSLAEETMHDDEEKLQAGAMRLLDVKQAQSQAASARSDLLKAQGALAVQENAIKSALGLRRDGWLGSTLVPSEPLVAVPENPDVRECWRTALETRPDMLQAKLKLELQHVQIKLDFNQMLPELDVLGNYGRNATEFTLDSNLQTIRQGTYPFYYYGFSLTIPLGNTAGRNTYKADKAGLQQQVLQIKKLELSIIASVDNDVENVRVDLPRVDSTRQARIYAEDALKAAQTQLRYGSTTTLVVLQTQQTLTSARLAEIQALATYNIDLEQLALDEGQILDRHHIDLRTR